MPFQRPEIIRPPSEWKSYFLPLTNGCSNNTCTFCNYYGSKLQIRDLEDIKREIDAVVLYMKNGVYIEFEQELAFLKADTVVLAVGAKSENKLVEELRGISPELYAIGDCVSPRDGMEAIREGAEIGRKI